MDGKVDFKELLVLSQSYEDAGPLFQGDFNHDQHIDFGDLLLLAQHFTGP